jgi:hypothetical protein
MDDRVSELVKILIACHGDGAEEAARKRANRCLRRRELIWAKLWREAAEQIDKRRTPALT